MILWKLWRALLAFQMYEYKTTFDMNMYAGYVFTLCILGYNHNGTVPRCTSLCAVDVQNNKFCNITQE